MAPKDGARPTSAPEPSREARTLPRARRIRKRAEFVEIQQSDARVTTRNLLMLLALRPGEGPARLGVVASRKVGPAVVRNRAKRLVREAFRSNPDVFPPRLDVVVVVRPGTHQLGADELAEQVRRVRPQIERRAAELGRSLRPRPLPVSPARGARDAKDVKHGGDAKGVKNGGDPGDMKSTSAERDTSEVSALLEDRALDRLRR